MESDLLEKDHQIFGESVRGFVRNKSSRKWGPGMSSASRIATPGYSYFPSALQVAAHEFGLPVDDPSRPLTVTGRLTFAGGRWNNYSTHAIATTATTRLQEAPDSIGLITASVGYLTKHAFGVYSSQPPIACHPAGPPKPSTPDRLSRIRAADEDQP